MSSAPAAPGQLPVHLDARERILQGSFYTPARYVRLAGDWLQEHGLAENCTVLDPSCGYGAFFALTRRFPHNRFIGNDIDPVATAQVAKRYPTVRLFCTNALSDVERARYGIRPEERLVVVGNPPYNDLTSQYQGRLKQAARPAVDEAVKSRDLGLSSLLAYDKLAADYVAVLHPLAYLLKRANFQSAAAFFANYRLLRHVVFSSHDFAGTSKKAPFPVLAGFYRRQPHEGASFDEIRRLRFTTIERKSFCINDLRYVSEFIDKYPNGGSVHSDIMFYTLRDINALRRSRTFLAKPTANAVFVTPEKLPYYCYIDCFKEFINKVPYYLGNCDVPIEPQRFAACREAVVAVAKWRHPEVFGPSPKPPKAAFQAVERLILSTIA